MILLNINYFKYLILHSLLFHYQLKNVDFWLIRNIAN